jgi:hypothetical protein
MGQRFHRGVPLGMSRPRPEYRDANAYGGLNVDDVRFREEPDEEDDDEEDDNKDEGDRDEDNEDDDQDDGYSV